MRLNFLLQNSLSRSSAVVLSTANKEIKELIALIDIMTAKKTYSKNNVWIQVEIYTPYLELRRRTESQEQQKNWKLFWKYCKKLTRNISSIISMESKMKNYSFYFGSFSSISKNKRKISLTKSDKMDVFNFFWILVTNPFCFWVSTFNLFAILLAPNRVH